MDLFASRSTFTYTVEQDVICIVDNDDGRSVTNDIENVLADLVKDGVRLRGRRVIYRDSQGVWDQVELNGDLFAGFRSVNETDKSAAITKVRS